MSLDISIARDAEITGHRALGTSSRPVHCFVFFREVFVVYIDRRQVSASHEALARSCA